MSGLAAVSIGTGDESSYGTRSWHLGVLLQVEVSLIGAKIVTRAAIALESSRNVRLTSVSVGALVRVAADCASDGSLGAGLSVEGLSCGAEVSCDGSTAVVAVLKSVETAQVVRWTRSLNIDETFPDGHVYSIHVSLLSIRADIHIGSSTADTVAGELVISTSEVGRTAV